MGCELPWRQPVPVARQRTVDRTAGRKLAGPTRAGDVGGSPHAL